jgi:hypothetical protein
MPVPPAVFAFSQYNQVMSDKDDSLIERAKRRARQAGEKYQTEAAARVASGADPAAAIGVGLAGGFAQTVTDARSPAQFMFKTTRSAGSALRVFADGLMALSDHDTQAQATGGGDQLTVDFRQRIPTGNWVSLLTVSMVQSGVDVTLTAGAPNLAALGGAAADLGGAALSAGAQLARGNLIGGAIEAVRNLGRAGEAIDALTFSSKVRGTIHRIGSTLEAEWRETEKARDAQTDARQRREYCQKCGSRWPTGDVTVCPACGAPREN